MKTISVKPSFIALIVLVASLTACQKPKEDTSKVTVNNIAGTYKITAESYEGNDGTRSDLYSGMEDCEKNSTQTYRTDMSYQEEDLCSPSDSRNSTWSLPSSNLLIVDGVAVDIISFDGHNLIVSMPFEVDNQQGKIKATLTKQ